MSYQHLPSKKQIPNISQCRSLQELIDNYPNQEIIPQFRQVMKHYPNFRAIRGDGNCFYRAIAFLYLARAPLQQFHNCFQNIKLACQNLPIDFQQEKNWKEQLAIMWENYLRPIASKNNREQQLVKIFNSFIVFDILMIAYFRSFNYHYINNNQAKFQPYTSKGVINELHRISTFNQESQGIQLISLAQALRIKITVAYADKNTFKNILYNEQGRDQGYYLFFRPGHYDIIYPSSENSLKYSGWNSVLDSSRKFIGSNIEKIIPSSFKRYANQQKQQKSMKNFMTPNIPEIRIQASKNSVVKENSFTNAYNDKIGFNANSKQKKVIDPRISNNSKSFQSKLSTTFQKNDIEKSDFKYMTQNSGRDSNQYRNTVTSTLRSSTGNRPPAQHFKVKDQLPMQFSFARFSMEFFVLFAFIVTVYLIFIR